ncbi:MAG: hypothetical protein M5U18_04360 [Dehalococcoidia bacterium]|nr:hypothetical protein [Dehalococcoidia bacterium]
MRAILLGSAATADDRRSSLGRNTERLCDEAQAAPRVPEPEQVGGCHQQDPFCRPDEGRSCRRGDPADRLACVDEDDVEPLLQRGDSARDALRQQPFLRLGTLDAREDGEPWSLLELVENRLGAVACPDAQPGKPSPRVEIEACADGSSAKVAIDQQHVSSGGPERRGEPDRDGRGAGRPFAADQREDFAVAPVALGVAGATPAPGCRIDHRTPLHGFAQGSDEGSIVGVCRQHVGQPVVGVSLRRTCKENHRNASFP